MANTQELMLRIRGDNTDAERKLGQTEKSVEGLDISTRKVSTAMKVFGRDLLYVRDSSDLLSAAARALGTVIAGSIGGTAVIAAGKALIDAYRSVQDSAKEAEKSITAVRKSAQMIGAGEGLATTAGAAKSLASEAEKVSEKLKEIESNKLKNFIAGLTGARERMAELVSETNKQAKALERQGVVNTLIDMERLKNLSETDKAVRQIAEKYQPIIDAARATGDEELLNRSILQAQAEQVEAIKKGKQAEAAESKRIADAQAAYDQKLATDRELYEIQRARNLERERAELQRQVKINEERLRQEQTMAEISEARLRFERSSAVYSGKGGATMFQFEQRKAESLGAGAEILGVTAGGRGALSVERQRRQRQVSREDFRSQEKILADEAKRLSAVEGRTLTKQDVRNRMAREIAKSEITTMEERRGGMDTLLNAVERLVNQIGTAPLVTSGAGK